MKKILRINASSRLQNSHSRKLADYFVAHWLTLNPNIEVVIRDLIFNPIPHINEDTIASFYTLKAEHDDRLKQATTLSDELIKEIMAADILLIDTPMYNFSVPSSLKAWIDHIVRINETFGLTPEGGFEGLIHSKRAFVITATGAVFSNEAMQSLDFLTPYLKMLLGFIGITEVDFIPLEGTTTDELAFEQSLQKAKIQISQLETQP